MKKVIVILLVLNIPFQTDLFSQDLNNCGCLKNNSIKYSLIFKTPSITESNKYIGDFVVVDLPKHAKKYFLHKNFNYWEERFNDTASDWAADLLLHYIYLREATEIHIVIMNKNLWNAVKKNDIAYWRVFFANGKKSKLSKSD